MFWLMKPDDYFDADWGGASRAVVLLFSTLFTTSICCSLDRRRSFLFPCPETQMQWRGNAVEETAAAGLRFEKRCASELQFSDTIVIAMELGKTDPRMKIPTEP